MTSTSAGAGCTTVTFVVFFGILDTFVINSAGTVIVGLDLGYCVSQFYNLVLDTADAVIVMLDLYFVITFLTSCCHRLLYYRQYSYGIGVILLTFMTLS